MKLIDWFRPGIKVKRWLLLGFFGVLVLWFALLEFVRRSFFSFYYKCYFIFLIAIGVFLLYVAISKGIQSVIALINKGYLNVSLDSKKIENLLYEKRLLIKGPKIVVIGGGTGLSTMLRGLKYYTSNITAIVTVADDGGGSGALREDLGILPPGDIRNCILALSDTEPLMEDLLQYRFKDGRLKNQSFGNLFLAAMDGISSNFEEAIKKVSSVLAVTGKVLPVTLDNVILKAKLKNGTIVAGESNIPKKAIEFNSPIDKIFIEPKGAHAVKEAVDAIKDADAVILGPGSLYTSIMPNLVFKDISTALQRTPAIVIYVANIMTQHGETDGYDVADHINAISKHVGKNVVDYVIANVGSVENSKYNLVTLNEKRIRNMGVEILKGDFINRENVITKHNTENLSASIIETIMEKKLFYDKKKIIEYFYLSERLKDRKKNRE